MNHKYKVGDKGFVRNGLSAYEVALIDPSVEKPLIVKVSHQNGEVDYYQYRIDGRFLRSGKQDAWDLTPPKECAWVNWYRSPQGDVWCTSYSSETVAGRQYDSYTGNSSKIRRAVKTEVPSDEGAN